MKELDRLRSACAYVWARRCEDGEKVEVQCVKLGSSYVLRLPGELFIEYQLAAQKMRPVLLEVAAAQNQRLKILNDYLPELFIRTRLACVILDIDASDDPAHGQQVLSCYHGYYEQNRYFYLSVFDGTTGFPLAAWPQKSGDVQRLDSWPRVKRAISP